MIAYNYCARDNTGKRIRGVIEALSHDEVAEKLRHMGYTPVTIHETFNGLRLEWKSRRIKTDAMVMFNVQLANMLNAGLSLISSLDALAQQNEGTRLGEIIGSLSRSVEAGESFSQALSHHPRVFSPLFINMVKAGEASGGMDVVLNRYAGFAESQADLKHKIREALYYPLLLVVATILVIVFIVSFLIPKFVTIFERAHIEIPLPTQILNTVGLGIRSHWYWAILGGILLVVALRWYFKTPGGRFRLDSWLLKLPLVGTIIRKTCVSRFARTLATLIGSGVPVLEALDIVRDVINNEVLAKVIGRMRASVETGERLAESLKVSQEFPPDTIQMIAVGEESGTLQPMLNKIGDFYERSVGYSIKKLVSSLEPIFLLVIGGVVAFTMASMLLPMFDMVRVIRAR